MWDTRSESAPVRLREGGMVARALAWSRTNEHVLATGELTVMGVGMSYSTPEASWWCWCACLIETAILQQSGYMGVVCYLVQCV